MYVKMLLKFAQYGNKIYGMPHKSCVPRQQDTRGHVFPPSAKVIQL